MTTATTTGQGVTCDEALRVARLDAEGAYRDLDLYRIEVTRESDGWHIDYELLDPRCAGGVRRSDGADSASAGETAEDLSEASNEGRFYDR